MPTISKVLCCLGWHKWGTLSKLYLFQILNKFNIRKDLKDEFPDNIWKYIDRICIKCGKRNNQIEKVIIRYNKFCKKYDELQSIAQKLQNKESDLK